MKLSRYWDKKSNFSRLIQKSRKAADLLCSNYTIFVENVKSFL